MPGNGQNKSYRTPNRVIVRRGDIIRVSKSGRFLHLELLLTTYTVMCNSSNLSSKDIVILASLRGASGFLCAIINVVLLTAISLRLDKSKSLQRLLVYLTTTSLLVLITNIMQSESIACWSPGHSSACKFVGTVNQFTAWIFMLVVMWIVSVIALRYWFHNHARVLSTKIDALILLGIVSVSFVVSIIPLATRGYGMNKAWCWIETSRVIEQWVLWYGWVIALSATIPVILGTALCYSQRKMDLYYESSRAMNNCKEKICKAEARKIKSLIFSMLVYLIAIIVVFVLNQVPRIKMNIPFLVIIAITEPLSVLIVPIVFVTHLHDAKKPPPSSSQNIHQRRAAIGPEINSEGSSVSVNKKDSSSKKNKKIYKYFHEDITDSLLFTETERSETKIEC